MTVAIKGLNETKNYLRECMRRINEGTPEVLQQVGELGWKYAQTIAPKDYGFLREAIINFPEGDEVWTILSSPPEDHPDFPLNVYIDESRIDKLNWGERTEPKTGEFGFMKKTAEILTEELSERLNILIERSLK